jgi:uncharacterized protein YvpB
LVDVNTIIITLLAWMLALLPFPGLLTSPTVQFLQPSHPVGEANDSQPAEMLLNVPVIQQLPELYNGCEVTSLAMLLGAYETPVNKLELAIRLQKDPTPLIGEYPQQITEWGDPRVGFVGDITGRKTGYGVYHEPLFALLQEYVGDQAIDLTGGDFTQIIDYVAQGRPVVAWTTVDFRPTTEWVQWKNGDKEIIVTFKEHTVLIVGFDQDSIFINDPLSGMKAEEIPKEQFVQSWEQLGRQALSILP